MPDLFPKPLSPPPSPELGRRAAIQIAILLLGAEVLTLVFYLSRVGADRLPVQLGRLALTGALCFALYRGQRWAWWTLLVLGLLAVLAGVLMVLAILGDGRGSAFLVATLVLAQLAVLRILIWDRALREYVDDSR